MLQINLPASAKRDDPRISSIMRKLEASFKSFALYNTAHAARSWADVKWKGRYYVGYLRYSCSQGTVTYGVEFCD